MIRKKTSIAISSAILSLVLSASASAQSFQLRAFSPGLRAQVAAVVTAPNLQVSGGPASSQAFGQAYVGESASPLQFAVVNAGNGAGSLSLPAFTGANPGDFNATTDCQNVAPGSSCEVLVNFRPTAIGSRSSALQIAHSDFTFSGTGQAAPTQYLVLKSGTSFQIPVGITSLTLWSVGAGGGGAGSTSTDSTSGGGGAAGGMAWSTFPVAAGQTLTYAIGAGGVGGQGGNHGTNGGNTTVTYGAFTLVGVGGGGGGFNSNSWATGGGYSGGSAGIAGGAGGSAYGDVGGGAGGALGGVNGVGSSSSFPAGESTSTGHQGATAAYPTGFASALAGAGEAFGSPGAGASSGSSGTANANNGTAAAGFGHGGGSAGYYGGNGGNGAIGGGGGGAAGYTGSQRGGAGGPGAVVLKLN